MVKYYGISNDIESNFDRVWVEINANAPFLAGNIQLGKYEFMLIAPATSNTVQDSPENGRHFNIQCSDNGSKSRCSHLHITL